MPATPLPLWLEQRGYSKVTFAKMVKAGTAPRVLRPPGMRQGIVTEADNAAWEKKMAAYAESEAGRREAERRREIARAGGRAAVESPRHYMSRKNIAARRAERARTKPPD